MCYDSLSNLGQRNRCEKDQFKNLFKRLVTWVANFIFFLLKKTPSVSKTNYIEDLVSWFKLTFSKWGQYQSIDKCMTIFKSPLWNNTCQSNQPNGHKNGFAALQMCILEKKTRLKSISNFGRASCWYPCVYNQKNTMNCVALGTCMSYRNNVPIFQRW